MFTPKASVSLILLLMGSVMSPPALGKVDQNIAEQCKDATDFSGCVKAVTKAFEWKNCHYNQESIPCRRTFLCGNTPPPCYRFRLEWKDGVRDSYSKDQSRISRANNIRYYKDPRGGKWTLISYGPSFFLINSKNKNTIIYDMTKDECRETPWDDLCPK